MFITFEGPDGSGKTTQVALLVDFLTRQGYSVFPTREPGGTSIGEQIRTILHSLENDELAPRTEILLYSASRAQIVEEIIRPRLARSEVVICDRFYDSTLAYQGYGHGLDLDILKTITSFATGGLKPDLTFYIEIDPETGLERRMQDKDAEWNRLDAYALDFHQRVYEGYATLQAAEPERWVVIDGMLPVDQVCERICNASLERLKQVR